MNKLLRILKHRWLDETDAQRALGEATLQRLAERVRASERRHSGEIRLCVEAGLPLSYLWRDATARERALAMFGKLRVWDTEHNNGVLIYLLLAEHAIEIVADRGLARKVPPDTWRDLARRMSVAFKAGRFEQAWARPSPRSSGCCCSTSRWPRARPTRTSCPTAPSSARSIRSRAASAARRSARAWACPAASGNRPAARAGACPAPGRAGGGSASAGRAAGR